MAVFELNVPVTTERPVVTVENPLQPGDHTFTLVVVDDRGLRSAAARCTVTVLKPIIVVDPLPLPPLPPLDPF